MSRSIGAIAVCLLFGSLTTPAAAQAIFTCVDAKGRRLTADRPIAECVGREQQELNASGTVKRRIGPVLSPEEVAAAEEKARRATEERSRITEEKKRDLALVTRYPDKAAHDKERALAIAQAEEVIATANKRTADLVAQRKRLDAELEFFKADPAKVPAKLKRQIEETDQNLDAQRRFVSNHEADKQRANARFDDELGRLQQLWAQRASTSTAKP